MTRNLLVTGAAALAAFGVVGCSSDGGSANGSGSAAGSGAGSSADVVAYHADYPAYDSLDAVIEESDLVVKGTVVGSRVEPMLPETSAGGDPATNPQAGLSPKEIARAEAEAEADPVVVTVSTVKVSQVLAGDAAVGDTVEVSQLGGTYKGVTYKERDTTTLAGGGTEYVLMLADNGTANPYDLLNPEQALYTVGSGGAVKAVSGGGFDHAGTVSRLADRTRRLSAR
ncbi:hypothetical protein ACIQ7D_17035 [Streptomyces sp. NPDC096310]|uniref:hypothetical protein n=1 Tax=Streptomyces sp. NPDC096310 TaxID=3366082 RepID=UPI003826E3FD